MNTTKLIFAVALILPFSGCKSKRAEIRDLAEVKISEAQGESRSSEKSEEKKDKPNPVAFYYDGYRLMEREEYQEAAKIFAKALKLFEEMRFYSKVGWDYEWKESYPGTLDENGECKEFYYSIYNLSCCMSLLGHLEHSEAYLYNAIIAGYPHLNHLLSDPDLANLYASPRGDEVKERAKELFACGNDADFFAGKRMGQQIYFDENARDAYFIYDCDDFDYVSGMKGTYTVRNFHIFVQLEKEFVRRTLGHSYGLGGKVTYDAFALDECKDINWQYTVSIGNSNFYEIYDKSKYLLEPILFAPNENQEEKREQDFSADEDDLEEHEDEAFFVSMSFADMLDAVVEKAQRPWEVYHWEHEDFEKNKEQNKLNEERRKKQAAAALIKLSEKEIDANAERWLARYREFADPIIQGYKEKGKIVTFDVETFEDFREPASPEMEFCYIVIKGMLKQAIEFRKICDATEELFPAGCFLDFTDCTFVGPKKLKKPYNNFEEFTFPPNYDKTPKAVGIKGIIFPKNLPDDINVYYENSSVEIMEFQDSASVIEIYFEWYKPNQNNSLKAVRLPEGLKEIGDYSFMNCAALEQVYAPKSLARIGHRAFDGCCIPAFEIPENVRHVGYEAFEATTKVFVPAYRHHPENFDWWYSWISYPYDWYRRNNSDAEEECVHWGSCME